MKRHQILLFFLILLALFATSCAKDNIVLVDPIASIDSDDDISNISFTNTVEVVFSDAGKATVTGVDADFEVSIHGNDVTIVYAGDGYVMYRLSGMASDGFFKLYSAKKQGLTLDGLDLINANGAAINLQGKCTFVVLQGSNALADGKSYTDTPETEDEKGVLFSEGQLIFSGEGSLDVAAQGKSGIVSDDYVVLREGTITVNVTSDAFYDEESQDYKGTAGIKVNDYFKMLGGELNITNTGNGGKGISSDGNGYFMDGTVVVSAMGSNYGKSAKAIKCDGDLLFAGGKVVASSVAHEGIEAKGNLTISSGEVYSYSAKDDAINSGGNFTITGGLVCAYAVNNDGLDANGNCYIEGGVVYAIGSREPEVAIDANSEGGYSLYLTGGTLIAIGGLERGATLQQSCYQAVSWSPNTWYAMTVGSETYAFKTPSSGGRTMVVSGASMPTLQVGVSVTDGTSCLEGMLYQAVSFSGGSDVSLSSYTGGNGGGPGPGPF